jgi:hypothetical protein
MKEIKKYGFFETPLSELKDVVSVKDIKEQGLKVEEHFAKVPVVFQKKTYTSKSGDVTTNYAMFIQAHPSVTISCNNKKFVNETEFTLLLMEFGLPFDTTQIKFNAYIRFLKGESAKIDVNDFVRFELYLGSNLSSIGDFVDGGSKLVINRLSMKTNDEIAKMKTEPFKQYPLFKLTAKEINAIEKSVETDVVAE